MTLRSCFAAAVAAIAVAAAILAVVASAGRSSGQPHASSVAAKATIGQPHTSSVAAKATIGVPLPSRRETSAGVVAGRTTGQPHLRPRRHPTQLWFNSSFGSGMVLQQAPSTASVYGLLRASSPAAVLVTATAAGETAGYTVAANVTPSACAAGCGEAGCGRLYHWRAFLRPTPANATAHVVTARAAEATARLTDVSFGDVFLCAGQSNMEMGLGAAFGHAALLQRTAERPSRIRVLFDGGYHRTAGAQEHTCAWRREPGRPGYGGEARWLPAHLAALENSSAGGGQPTLLSASAVCYHFADALSRQLRRDGAEPPPIGLISVAYGGSAVAQWLPPGSGEPQCRYALGGELAGGGSLFASNVAPHVATALKSVLWCPSFAALLLVAPSSRLAVWTGTRASPTAASRPSAATPSPGWATAVGSLRSSAGGARLGRRRRAGAQVRRVCRSEWWASARRLATAPTAAGSSAG